MVEGYDEQLLLGYVENDLNDAERQYVQRWLNKDPQLAEMLQQMIDDRQAVVALPQLSGWKKSFAPYFRPFKKVLFLPDPGAASQWARYARDVPGARVAALPADPDEYLTSIGGNVDALWRALRYAEAAA